MGREIRRVPLDWEHPRRDNGTYQPLHDEEYDTAARRWIDGFLAWERGDRPSYADTCRYYWEWQCDPPDPDDYRPAWDSEPTGYQLYETVSEGTPVSPVFAAIDDLILWLVDQGYRETVARQFVERGYAPSGAFVNGQYRDDIEVAGA